MILAVLLAVASLSQSDAIAILLNSPSASSRSRYAAAMEMVRRDAEDGKPLQQFVLGITTDDKALAKRYIEASGAQITALAAELCKDYMARQEETVDKRSAHQCVEYHIMLQKHILQN